MARNLLLYLLPEILPLISGGSSTMSTTRTVTGVTPRRVLIIDDNRDGRESLRRLVLTRGFEVEVAEDGLHGLRKAIDWEPDVAIVDIGLPGLDGYEVARRVRQALGGRVVLVALTGYCGPEVRKLALDAGFDEQLTKATDLDELLLLLGSV